MERGRRPFPDQAGALFPIMPDIHFLGTCSFLVRRTRNERIGIQEMCESPILHAD
jgi:hypothetical protein